MRELTTASDQPQAELQCYQWRRHKTMGRHNGRPVHQGQGAWITTLPTHTGLQIPVAAYVFGIVCRLGCPLARTEQCCPRALPGKGAPCGQSIDAMERHATLCCKGQQQNRHHGVRDALARLVRASGLYTMVEQCTRAEIRA